MGILLTLQNHRRHGRTTYHYPNRHQIYTLQKNHESLPISATMLSTSTGRSTWPDYRNDQTYLRTDGRTARHNSSPPSTLPTLCNRGNDPPTLRLIFQLAIKKTHKKNLALTDSDDEKSCFLRLTYHPQDPSSTVIQLLFRNTMLNPAGSSAYRNYAASRATP